MDGFKNIAHHKCENSLTLKIDVDGYASTVAFDNK